LPRCTTGEFFFFCSDSVAAHFKHAATCQPVVPQAQASCKYLRRQHRVATAADIGLGTTAKYMQQTTSGAAGSVAAFVVNAVSQTGARPSVRLCVGPELALCGRSNKIS
jgi:hypothetical protein